MFLYLYSCTKVYTDESFCHEHQTSRYTWFHPDRVRKGASGVGRRWNILGAFIYYCTTHVSTGVGWEAARAKAAEYNLEADAEEVALDRAEEVQVTVPMSQSQLSALAAQVAASVVAVPVQSPSITAAATANTVTTVTFRILAFNECSRPAVGGRSPRAPS